MPRGCSKRSNFRPPWTFASYVRKDSQMSTLKVTFTKGFLQSEVLGEVPSWREAVQGEVCREVFCELFGLVLLGHSEQKKLQQKLQAQSPTALHSKTGENSGKKPQDEVLQGEPPPPPRVLELCMEVSNITGHRDAETKSLRKIHLLTSQKGT